MKEKIGKKKCIHVWEHRVIRSKSQAVDSKVYDWLIHKCKKCGLEVGGDKLVYGKR